MDYQRLSLERDGPILRVWLDRPERRNALDGRTLAEIEALYTGLAEDFETRLVVLGGRGPCFSAGADRKDPPGSERMRSGSEASDRERRHAAQLG
ncbi:MAG: enoyl-CoA hydratase/isomerase family protein, partial [Myxococcales bacterium]|nr:enoyl-CoA hydratase/isomerase family protein [Myxococcales bacterium]